VITSSARRPEYIMTPDVNFPSGKNCARMSMGYSPYVNVSIEPKRIRWMYLGSQY
jgi:hypothetical protein